MDELNNDTVVTETEPTVPDDAQTKDILEETYQEMSPIRLVMRRFFRSKLSLVGLIMVVFLFLFSFLGPVVYNRWGEDNPDNTPQVKAVQSLYTDDKGNTVTEVVYITKDINMLADPSWDHLLGTDDKGMDVFTRLMYGGRISLSLVSIIIGGFAIAL